MMKLLNTFTLGLLLLLCAGQPMAQAAASAAKSTASSTAKPTSRKTIARDPWLGAIVLDATTGKVLYEDQADAKGYPASVLKLMDLLIKDAVLEMVERAFRESPGLTYKLLLLVNSVSLGLRGKIHNIRHAVAILGRQQIKRWVQLALFVTDTNSGPENPLVEFAAVRAAFMEQLACRHTGLKDIRDAGEQAFLVGILSLLGSIYDIPLDEILAHLSLSEDVKDALTTHSGALGDLLKLSEQLERLDSSPVAEWLAEIGLSQEDVLQAQVKAYGWRDGML